MSIIAGIIRFTGEPVLTADLTAAAARMIEPGIGEAQFWANHGAGFVAKQKVVTLEDLAEQQPWVGCDGQWVLIHDGRIDNREELAQALGIHLHCDMVPDGQLLLLALERWGEAALPRLLGDFVFALWDIRQQRLLLARDQMGRRTLYYHHGNGFLAFANTYPALLALPCVPSRVDELGIADFLILNMHHPENTFYEQVRRLPKAHYANYDRNGLKLSRYWSPEPGKTVRLSNDEEYVEAAREHLERAVACRLRAKDGIAAQISGGLDSSAVATSCARLLAPNRLLAICSVPPEGMELPAPGPAWYNDERPYLAQIAPLHPNLDIQTASSREPHWIEQDPRAFFEVAGLPMRNISNIGWFLPGYEQVAHVGITVLLTGTLGNAAWSFDGVRSLSDMFRQGRWLRLVRELYLTGKRAPLGREWQYLLKKEVIRPQFSSALLRQLRRLRVREVEPWTGYSAINPAFAREIGLYERCRAAGHDADFAGTADGQGMMRSMLNRNEHGADITTALRSFTGIEQRTPLLDVRLIEFFLALPQEQFLKDGLSRRIARRALADRLPHTVLDKERIGMQNPEILHRLELLRPGFAAALRELRQSSLVSRCIDLPRLEQIVRDWPQQGMELWLTLPRAMNVAHFLRWTECGLV